jgi:hypothetical protein
MTVQRRTSAVIRVLLAGTLAFVLSSAKAQTAGPQTVLGTPIVNEPVVANRHSASCTEGDTLTRRVDFADVHRARHFLGHTDPWARQLSDFDLGARQKTTVPTSLQEFLSFAANAGLSWTDQEQAAWRPLLDKLSDAMKGLSPHIPNIDLVKTTGKEEFDAAYTRERAIMFPQRMASEATINPRLSYFRLAHELFHVLSRADSRLRDDLYSLLGFRPVKGFEYPFELEDRRVSNPDAFEYLHTLTVQAGSMAVDVLPVNQSRLPLNDVIQLPNFFAALDIVLLSVDTSTGAARRDGNGNLIKYNFGNTNWVPLTRRNSSFIIHPEEVLADNFATLMEWRSDGVLQPVNAAGFVLNDVNLLLAIQEILTNGCRK